MTAPTTSTPLKLDTPARPTHVYGVLLAGIIAVSFAAIFVRWAQAEGMPSLLIAAGRLTLAAALLTPLTLARHRSELTLLTRADLLFAAAAGVLLAIHFATWIASLEYTSVLISVVFVSTSPLWVALLEWIVFRAGFKRLVAVGLTLAVIGGLIIGTSGAPGEGGSNPPLGAGLALAGGLAVALYLVIGRKVRAKLSILPYIWLVYGCAAVFLLILLVVTATPITGFSPRGYGMIVLLALIPQLIGHTSFNYAVRYLSATYISIAMQMEPIGSAIAAIIVFGELPQVAQLFGAAAILAGVTAASWGQRDD